MMKTKFHYRLGNQADIEQLIPLGLISYGQFKEAIGSDNANQLAKNIGRADFYKGLLTKSTCFVCEQKQADSTNAKIVGMAFIIPSGNPDDIFLADWSYIRMVGVHPDFAGNGIGKQLTYQCIEEAKNNQEKYIALHTSEMMKVARYIYEKIGFKQIKEIPKRLGQRYWLYLMELNG